MTNKNQNTGAHTERRKHAHIRDIFDDAYRLVFPLLSSHGDGVGLPSHSMLHQALHNAFPDLHKQDVPILIASLTRVFREQNKADAP
ncbi:MAG: hypothetical protein KJ850_07090 [Gammaproteobacteria bacterium]|nr:hypothetical protein [Gammaproteobacteria bacterium]MBU1624799.1 hypothetical protein [Gammaproteobacteria bacterium]MBU1982643.1 hypothetical protein [Gammaproteobacteria bacterium]